MTTHHILTLAMGLRALGAGSASAQVLPQTAIAEINRSAQVRVHLVDFNTARLMRPRADSARIAFQRVAASDSIDPPLTSPVPLSRVRAIDVPHGTQFTSGLVVGTVVGIGLGLAFIESGGVLGGRPLPGETARALIRGGVTGAVVGAAIGLLVTGWQRVYPARR